MIKLRHLLFVSIMLPWTNGLRGAEVKPAIPHIENIVLAPAQLHASSPDVIWYDNFDTLDAGQWKYLEPRPDSPQAKLWDKEALGGAGKSMECFYAGCNASLWRSGGS